MERDAEGRAAQTRRCTITTSVVRRVWSSLCLLIGLILLQSPSSPSSILPLLPSLHVASGFFLARINSTNIEAPSPFFVFGVREFLLTGELIRGFPEHGCEKLATNVTGKVVWIEPYHCSIETKIRNCAAAGCAAAVSSSSYRIPGNEMWTAWDGSNALADLADKERTIYSRLSVPFVHVGREDACLIREALDEREEAMRTSKNAQQNVRGIGSTTIGTSVDGSTSTLPSSTATVVPALTTINISGMAVSEMADFHVFLSSSDSPNQWQEAFGSLYFTLFFQIMLGCLHIIVVLAAMAKFHRYYQLRLSRPFYAKIPLVCLAFIVASNLERGLYCFLDPMGALHVVPRGYRRVLISISVPWTYASTLLLTFFWSEAMDLFTAPKQTKPQPTTIDNDTCESTERVRSGSIEMMEVPKLHMSKRPTSHPKKHPNGGGRRSKLLSIGHAGQYSEPFQQHDLEDEYQFEEYVDRDMADGERYTDIDEETETPRVTEDVGEVAHTHATRSPLNVHLSSPVSPLPKRIIYSPPPPPASPPYIPAPSTQFLLSPVLVPNARLAGLKAEPLFLQLPMMPIPGVGIRRMSVTHTSMRDMSSTRTQAHQVLLPMQMPPSDHTGSLSVSVSHTDRHHQQSPPPQPQHRTPKNEYNFLPTLDPQSVSEVAKSSRSTSSDEPSAHHQFLTKYQIPFIVSAFFLTFLDLTFSILDSMYILDWQLVPVVDIIFASIGVMIGSMYFYVSWRVIRRFKEDAASKIRSAEYNADAQGGERQGATTSPDILPNTPTHGASSEVEQKEEMYGHRPSSPRQPYQQLGKTKATSTAKQQPIRSAHTSHLISDIQRSYHDRMVRMSQFLFGSGFGLLLFLGVTFASPQFWQLETSLDDPFTTISRDFLILLALFIIQLGQVCAF